MLIGLIGKYPDAEFAGKIGLYREMGVDVLDVQVAEINAQVKEFVAEARKRGIPVASLAPRWGWIDRAIKDPSEVDLMLDFIHQLPVLGIKTINMSCSFIRTETDEERRAHFWRCVEIFRTVCPLAEARGVNICSHTTLYRPGIIFGSVEGIDAFLDAVGSPINKLLLCTGCLSVARQDVPALIRHWRDSIGSVHLFNHEMGDLDHSTQTRFDVGQMDMAGVLKALREIEYDGVAIPHEYPAFSGPAGREISDGWVVGYLIGMRQALGLL